MDNLEAPHTFLPAEFHRAHHLCFVNHDILAELLRSGEKHGSFSETFAFRDENDRTAFDQSSDVFDWFDRTGRVQERNGFLRRSVFPALLSDFLHFTYECLDTSRKAKLNISYSLIRKPIQENLFLLEVIATDLDLFATHLAANPLALRAQKAGGLDVHERRIAKALDIIGDAALFDAAYLAQLRYGRSVEDCFDPSCNKATHLFTEHPALRTEPLNINFIFSDWDSKVSQWSYLYSRLPYLLFYARRIVEHVCSRFSETDPEYLADLERRVMAETLLWSNDIAEPYREPRIDRFVSATRARLGHECTAAGYRTPNEKDLLRMMEEGALPGESSIRVRLRNARYELLAKSFEYYRFAQRFSRRWK